MNWKIPDRIVLGHNGFFGVDHLSLERASQRSAFFSESKRIMEVVSYAQEQGAGGMMMSTHERSFGVVEGIKANPKLRENLRVYPLLPYVQKYVTSANEVGMLGVVSQALSGTTLTDKLALFWQGSKGVLGKDLNAILSAMIRLELKHFVGLQMPAIFLHDVFTDLALGLGLKSIFEFYLEEIPREYGAKAAFATKNLPMLLEKFEAWGIQEPVVLSHFNKSGYHMNPNRERCEQLVTNHELSVMAMGTLASGYLKPKEAYGYLANVPHIDSVVVGASSRSHIDETFDEIKSNYKNA